jgi:hypothetical protein
MASLSCVAHPPVRRLLCLKVACNLPSEQAWSAAQAARQSPMLNVRLGPSRFQTLEAVETVGGTRSTFRL